MIGTGPTSSADPDRGSVLQRAGAELFGKRLLVTDREDQTIAEVVAAYRSHNDAGQGFRATHAGLAG